MIIFFFRVVCNSGYFTVFNIDLILARLSFSESNALDPLCIMMITWNYRLIIVKQHSWLLLSDICCAVGNLCLSCQELYPAFFFADQGSVDQDDILGKSVLYFFHLKCCPVCTVFLSKNISRSLKPFSWWPVLLLNIKYYHDMKAKGN